MFVPLPYLKTYRGTNIQSMATKVKLRQKPISGNRQTLYLDFYPPITDPKTGKLTRREFLGFYLLDEIKHLEEDYIDETGKLKKRFVQVIDGKTKKPKKVVLDVLEKQHNVETMQLAQQIQRNRENQINKPEVYTGFEKEQLRLRDLEEQSFIDYFKGLSDKSMNLKKSVWLSTISYLEIFSQGVLKFSDLNEKFCNNFRDYLLTTKSIVKGKGKLSTNSAKSYFEKFRFAIGEAHKEGLLIKDINMNVKNIKAEETHRNYLSLEEINLLVKTECKNPILKNAAIFSAMTGLRFSDIQKLVWSELEYIEGNGYFINFRQQKTKGIEMMPISKQAFSLLGERKHPDDLVFDRLIYSGYQNLILCKWVLAAKITKDITFHSFRHTFATLQLSAGTDIYTVSKMLGHRDLKTTQIYAKVIDSSKRDAADRIKLDF